MKRKVNGCAKGKAKEREACHFLTNLGFPCERNARNGLSTSDLKALCPELERVHVEVKANRAINLGTAALDKALNQAHRDANGKPYAVLWWGHPRWRLSWYDESQDLMTTFGPSAIRRAIFRLDRMALTAASAAGSERGEA